MVSGQLSERKGGAEPWGTEERPSSSPTTLLDDAPWVTDSLVMSPDSVTALRFTSPLSTRGPVATAPFTEEDRLLAEQFEQLKQDLIYTLGEMSTSARGSAVQVWHEAIVQPVWGASDFLAWLWWQSFAAVGQGLRTSLRFCGRALRYAGAVVLDFILLVLELLDGDGREAVAPRAAAVPPVTMEPDLQEMARAGIRFLDRRGFPFTAGTGSMTNHDFELKQALDDIRRMARYASSLPVPTEGPFAGMKMSDVMLTVTLEDLYACFRNLLSRREAYQGKTLKLAETYALWALEGAQRPEMPSLPRRGRL